MPSNNNNSYISPDDPISEVPVERGQLMKFSRSWFRFFDLVSRKVKILDGTQTASATAGTASALPATPAGYLTIIDQSGTPRKVPYYNA